MPPESVDVVPVTASRDASLDLAVDDPPALAALAELPPARIVEAIVAEARARADADFAAIALLLPAGAQLLAAASREPALAKTFADMTGPYLYTLAAMGDESLLGVGVRQAGPSTLVALRALGRTQGMLLLYGVRREACLAEGGSLAPLAAYAGLALATIDVSARLTAREKQVERMKGASSREGDVALGRTALALASRVCNPVEYLRKQVALATEALGEDGPAAVRRALADMGATVGRLEETRRDLDRLLRDRPVVFDVIEAVRMACRLAGMADVAVEVPAAEVRGSIADVARALACLLENGRESVQRAGTGRVRVEGRRRGDRVVVAVIDDGVGLDPAKSHRLFEAGYSTWGREGRGLVRAAALASRFGGRVELRSVAEVGTVASLAMPIAEAGEGGDPLADG
jgi:signal transduction histidine kinase